MIFVTLLPVVRDAWRLFGPAPDLDAVEAHLRRRRRRELARERAPPGPRPSPRAAAMSELREATERALAGGPERHREKAREQGKLPVRERVALLLDEGSFAEEALLANWQRGRPRRRRRRDRRRRRSTGARWR